jgi:TRAP-type C4-dicarboxylate transport system permease small subunit
VSVGAEPGAAMTAVPHGRLERLMERANRIVLVPCMLALLGAAGILTYSVAVRYFFKVSTDWQDEAAVFLLVGATFLSGAYIQSYRGHVGIEALTGLLPARANGVRLFFVDLVTSAFCAFFTWKSWTLLQLAWSEGQTTTSTWGPPLWIPYSLMAVGMTLFTFQALLHLGRRLPWGRP